MYHLNIQIKEENKKLKLSYEQGILPEDLRLDIKKHKQALLERLQENDEAKQLGFCIYNHGDLLEYRYGNQAYLYVERLPGGFADAWRANYKQGETEPYKVKVVAKNVPYSKAFEKAAGFVRWLNKQNKRWVS